MKISCKSVQKLWRQVADRQTNPETNKQRRLHILLGGGNNIKQTQINAQFNRKGVQ